MTAAAERATVLAVKKPVFLKLGGSLITDKSRPYTPRPEKLADLATQIATARRDTPDLRLILGHGSGSFGHAAASKYRTRRGVSGAEAWRGFAEVWFQASVLNRLVMEALRHTGMPAIAFPPSAGITAHDGQIRTWDIQPIQAALEAGLLPVIYGDVVFDEVRGGTILSTEDLFAFLARALHPKRILLAGLEAGVWADFPARTRLVGEITPENIAAAAPGLGGSAGADVTGGMTSKVQQMLALVSEIPDLEVLIFSGEEPQAVQRTLLGGYAGTVLRR